MKKSLHNLIQGINLPARASVWYMGASVIGKAVGVLGTPVFTRLLDSESYGRFTLYMSLLGGASVIISGFNSGSAFYTGIKKNEDNKDAYLKRVLSVTIAFSLIICLLLFTFSSVLAIESYFFLPLTIQLLCDGITAIMLSRARFYYKYRSVVAVTLINAILPPVISFFIMAGGYADFRVRIFSLLFVSAATALYALVIINKSTIKKQKIKNCDDREKRAAVTVKDVIGYALPMLPHSLWSAISLQSDKLVISSLMGADAVGKYSVIYSVGVGMQFIVSAVGSALFPWIIRRLECGEEDRIRRLVYPLILGYSAVVLSVYSIAPEIISILAPKEYLDAFPALLPILLCCPFYFISSVMSVGIVHMKKARASWAASLAGGAICIISNYLLTRELGYYGAGLSVLVSQATNCLMGIFIISSSRAKEMIRWQDVSKIAIISLSVGVIYSFAGSLITRLILLILPAAIFLYSAAKLLPQITEKGGEIRP